MPLDTEHEPARRGLDRLRQVVQFGVSGHIEAVADRVDPLVVVGEGGVDVLARCSRGERAGLEADIVVGAVGKPEFIKAAWIRDGAVVVDAGYHPGNVGDVELAAVVDRCAAYTPVPGGVGPMTIATLMAQTVAAAEASLAG